MKSRKIVKNEKEFAEWFIRNYRKFGFSKIIKRNISTSPDFILLKNNKKIGVELETLASNFILHKHKISKIDLVFCLVKDVNLGITTIEIKDLEYQPKFRKVTLSINDKVYNKFQTFCRNNDINLSRRVERLIKEEIEKFKQGKKEVKR